MKTSILIFFSIIALSQSRYSSAQTLVGSDPIIGGVICHYSDGSSIRKSGDSYCERNKRNASPNYSRSLSKYLLRIEPIVGGARCYYSDGTVTRISGSSNCPRN